MDVTFHDILMNQGQQDMEGTCTADSAWDLCAINMVWGVFLLWKQEKTWKTSH